ncbi:MAG: class I SAM-dependent methyltransferase [Bacteroidales bacterium]|nr:class I SAM-dependent methyltransferase [Bacteroidales bacterium]
MERNLLGIDFNIEGQLALLEKFNYNNELLKFPRYTHEKKDVIEYCYNDEAFRSGDAEYLYSIIRLFKPLKIIEIGSGSSTLMAINATKQNTINDPEYICQHICIEPFENKWLESLGIQIHRKLVEEIDISYFTQLNAGDILFIDSSHMIRPQGDVLFEYLEILPTLKSGVIIHVHDIFSPRDYLKKWMELPYFWNEQYLLEAFLTNNKDFQIIGALNYLRHNYYDNFSKKCPILKAEVENGVLREPGSFWIVKT